MGAMHWIFSAGLGGLLVYVLFRAEGRDMLLYYLSFPLSLWRIGRRLKVRSYIQKEGEFFRQSLNREVPGIADAPLHVEWVRDETKEQFLDRGRVVVRMRDQGARHKNLAAAALLYVRGAVVPQARQYLGADLSQAIDFTLTKKMLVRSTEPAALQHFVDEVSGPEVLTRQTVREYCQALEGLEQLGYFTHVFLREAREVARLIFPRTATEGDVAEWSDFVEFLRPFGGPGDEEHAFDFRRAHLHVSIGLIAARVKLQRGGITQYVERAGHAIDVGADVVYLSAWGGNCVAAKRIARALEGREDVDRVEEGPPILVRHPRDGLLVRALFIAVHTKNRQRLSVPFGPVRAS